MTAVGPHLVEVLASLGSPEVLVVGDLILDRYLWGKVERVSPEAPVPVLVVEREEERLGGAGSVVANLAALGARVSVCGVVGTDREGDALVAELQRLGARTDGVTRHPARRTTVKTRMIANVQHVLRVDHEETDPFEPPVDAALCAYAREAFPRAAIAIVSDYDKGLLKGALLDAVVAARRDRPEARVLLDPRKGPDYSRYRGVSAVTPNRAETELATGIRPADEASCGGAAERLIDSLDLECAAITLDKDGIWLQGRGERGRLFPTRTRAVYDVTGAGDMVISVLGMALACGRTWAEAVELANAAAGVEVSKVGAAPVTRREIRDALLERDCALGGKVRARDELQAALREHRRRRERVVFTNGCFDLVHVGHLGLLRFAKAQGDVLVVGLNSDRSVRAVKGSGRPVVPEADRAALLAALSPVDYVTLFDEETPAALVEALRPDVLVKGEDWRDKGVVGRDTVESYGGRVVLAPAVAGQSTTGLIDRILEGRRPERRA